MKKILFSASIDMLTEKEKATVNKHCDMTTVIRLDDLNKIANIHNYEAWVVHPCPDFVIGSAIAKKFPNLKLIVTPTTGTTHLNVTELNESGIRVEGLKGSSVVNKIKASSEFTFIHVLNAVRNFSAAIKHVEQGLWRENDDKLRGREFCESTVGVIGLGRIGGNVANWSKAMGAKVIYFDPFVEDPNFFRADDMMSLLRDSDIVVVAVHLNSTTNNLIRLKHLKAMKKSAWLVNTSRGEIVSENDLIFALKNKIIRGASLDVIANENSMAKFSSISVLEYAKNNSNLIITPHVAGLSVDSERKAQMFAFEMSLRSLSSV